MTPHIFQNTEISQLNRSIDQKYSEKAYEEKAEGLLNNSYEIERELVRYIETGNLEGIHMISFSSQSHFQKAFKDLFGITPQTFRKSAK